MIVLGFLCSLLGYVGLLFALPFWIAGTLVFAKSYLD